MRRLILAALLVPSLLLPACNMTSQSRVQSIHRLNEGIKQAKKNNISGAERAMKDAIKVDPTHSIAYYNLGKLFLRQQKWAEAEKQYESAIRTLEQPNANYNYELGVVVENQAYAPGVPRNEQYAIYTRAIKAYEEALKLNPNLYKAHYHIGLLNEKMDKPVVADKHYRAALKLNAKYSPSFVSLGNMYIDYGFSNVAMAVLNTGTKINDTDAAMWNGLGRAMLNLNRGKEAVDAYQNAKAIDPDMPDVLFGLGMAYAELRMRNEATENLELFLRKAGANVPEHIQKSARDTLARMNDVI